MRVCVHDVFGELTKGQFGLFGGLFHFLQKLSQAEQSSTTHVQVWNRPHTDCFNESCVGESLFAVSVPSFIIDTSGSSAAGGKNKEINDLLILAAAAHLGCWWCSSLHNYFNQDVISQ